MRRLERTHLFTVLVLVIALLAAACGGGSNGSDNTSSSEDRSGPAEGKPTPGGDLVDLQNFAQGEPDHIDPGLSATVQGSQPGELLFDGLAETDYKTGELKPMVAESWKTEDKGKTWIFKLRKDVKWSNGDAVLPSDFKFAWERVVQKDMASEVAYHFDPIVGKKAIDDGTSKELTGVKADDANMTLTVELEYPYSTFPATTSHLVFSPVPKKVLQGLPDQSKWEQGVMIGNGPFKQAEPWKHEQEIKLVRNENYWGGLNDHKAYLSSLTFKISKDVDSAFADFEAGNGQTGYIPPGRYQDVKAKYGERVADKPILGIYDWGFNMKDPTVGGPENLKLRQAIALAIDKKAIVDTVYGGLRKVATGWTPPGIPGYKSGLSTYGARDVAKAKQLLKEYGKTPPTLKLNFGAGAGHEPVATIVQANLKEIGINSELAGSDTTTYFKDMRQGKGQFLRAGWFWDYVAYDNGIYPLFDTAAIGGDNLYQYSNPKVDDLITKARAELDDDKRAEIYQQAEKIVLDDAVVVPLNWYAGQIAYADNVQNLIQGSLGFVAYDEIYLNSNA